MIRETRYLFSLILLAALPAAAQREGPRRSVPPCPSVQQTIPTSTVLPLPSDIQVERAVHDLVSEVRRGGGTVTVKGVRRTPDGGGEADLVFNNFEYHSAGMPKDRFSGDGMATIARYSEGYFLTRVTWAIGPYVSGKTYLEPGAKDGKPVIGDLLAAIKLSKPDAVRELLDRGAPLNGRSPITGVTPLLLAAGDNEIPIVRVLLDRGANPNLSPSCGLYTGVTPLMMALNSPQVITMLLEKGANPNQVLPDGKTMPQYLRGSQTPNAAAALELLRKAGAR